MGLESKIPKNNTHHVGIHQRFGDILNYNLLVEEPTRHTQTRNLLITNQSYSFTRMKTNKILKIQNSEENSKRKVPNQMANSKA